MPNEVQPVHITNHQRDPRIATPYMVYNLIGLGVTLAQPEGTGFWKVLVKAVFWPVQLGYWLAQKGVL